MNGRRFGRPESVRGNLAAFVRPFRLSEGLVPLGHMDEAAIEALRRGGRARVRLELLP